MKYQRSNIKNQKYSAKIKNILYLICIFDILFLIFDTPSYAEEMKSQNFTIQGGNFNMASGSNASTNYTLSDVVGETAAGLFASKGYLVHSGFQNSAATGMIGFSVTPHLIDFGQITPHKPVEQRIVLKITETEGSGYTVTVIQNHSLSTVSGAEIPDTICILKGTPCTFIKAQIWRPEDAFGLGYSMSGPTVTKDFINENFYRPFPSIIRGDAPSVVMEDTSSKVTHESLMKLRVVINETQPVGNYSNTITFSALAGI